MPDRRQYRRLFVTLPDVCLAFAWTICMRLKSGEFPELNTKNLRDKWYPFLKTWYKDILQMAEQEFYIYEESAFNSKVT